MRERASKPPAHRGSSDTLALEPMIAGRLGTRRALVALIALATLGAVIAGCGTSGGSRRPDLAKLPLVNGANVIAQVHSCDEGKNAYCAIELVVVDRSYKNSTDLVEEEH